MALLGATNAAQLNRTYVVAPTNCLDPMNTAGIYPNQIARPLNEPINGNICFIEIVKHRPPRTVQIVDVVLFAQRLNATPIRVGHGKPFTIARPNVDVDRTEIVVLLVAGCS